MGDLGVKKGIGGGQMFAHWGEGGGGWGWGALLFEWRSEGDWGRAESHPDFLPEYLYPVGFFANYGPKVSKGQAESPLVRPQAHIPAPGGA